MHTYLWSPRAVEAAVRLHQAKALNRPGSAQFRKASERLAVWLDARGEWARAADLLQAVPPSRTNPSALGAIRLMQGQLLRKCGRWEEASELLDGIRTRSSSWHLARANLEPTADRKLDRVNRIYEAGGIAPLRMRDPEAPLSPSNLQCAGDIRPIDSRGTVSVIFPVFNAKDTIAAAVRSMREQSYGDTEIILVDDRSTDGTYDILSDLARSDPAITALRMPRNGGAYRARNLGLARATGAFVSTHDADDWSHPEKLARQVAALCRKDIIATGSHWVRADEKLNFTTWDLRPTLIRRSLPSFMVRREVFDAVGTWDPVRISGDAEFIYRVGRHYGEDRVAWIDGDMPLGISLAGNTSLTNTPATHVSSAKHGLRRYYHEMFRHQWREGRGLDPAARAERLRLAPPELSGAERVDRLYAANLVGDFRSPAVAAQMSALCAEIDGPVAVTHVPEIDGGEDGPFCDEIFALIRRPGILIEHDHGTVRAERTVILRP